MPWPGLDGSGPEERFRCSTAGQIAHIPVHNKYKIKKNKYTTTSQSVVVLIAHIVYFLIVGGLYSITALRCYDGLVR